MPTTRQVSASSAPFLSSRQSLMDNPEMIRSMFASNPQMQAVLEANPQLNHMLNDPALMRQSMEMARNPAAMQQVSGQRGGACVRGQRGARARGSVHIGVGVSVGIIVGVLRDRVAVNWLVVGKRATHLRRAL